MQFLIELSAPAGGLDLAPIAGGRLSGDEAGAFVADLHDEREVVGVLLSLVQRGADIERLHRLPGPPLRRSR